MPGEHLDLSSDPPEDGPVEGEELPSARRFLGIHFACCGVYSRVYLDRKRTAYAGRCPRCASPVRFEIGPGGSDARFFTVE